MPDLITERIKHLVIAITLFNKFVQENKLQIAVSNQAKETSTRLSANNPIDLDSGTNPKIDELFLEAQDVSSVISNLASIFL